MLKKVLPGIASDWAQAIGSCLHQSSSCLANCGHSDAFRGLVAELGRPFAPKLATLICVLLPTALPGMLRSAVTAGAYRDAYMSLSAAAVFAPFVRLELLKWDPIFTGQAGAASLALLAAAFALQKGTLP